MSLKTALYTTIQITFFVRLGVIYKIRGSVYQIVEINSGFLYKLIFHYLCIWVIHRGAWEKLSECLGSIVFGQKKNKCSKPKSSKIMKVSFDQFTPEYPVSSYLKRCSFFTYTTGVHFGQSILMDCLIVVLISPQYNIRNAWGMA